MNGLQPAPSTGSPALDATKPELVGPVWMHTKETRANWPGCRRELSIRLQATCDPAIGKAAGVDVFRLVFPTFNPSRRRVSERVPPVSRASSGSFNTPLCVWELIVVNRVRVSTAPSCG